MIIIILAAGASARPDVSHSAYLLSGKTDEGNAEYHEDILLCMAVVILAVDTERLPQIRPLPSCPSPVWPDR